MIGHPSVICLIYKSKFNGDFLINEWIEYNDMSGFTDLLPMSGKCGIWEAYSRKIVEEFDESV